MTIKQKHLVFIPICFAAALALCSAIVMLLWNATMPGIFALPAINFWQSLCLLLLCKILFGAGTIPHHGHHGHGCHKDTNKLRESWENMPAEQRERIARMHGCCNMDSTNKTANEE